MGLWSPWTMNLVSGCFRANDTIDSKVCVNRSEYVESMASGLLLYISGNSGNGNFVSLVVQAIKCFCVVSARMLSILCAIALSFIPLP